MFYGTPPDVQRINGVYVNQGNLATSVRNDYGPIGTITTPEGSILEPSPTGPLNYYARDGIAEINAKLDISGVRIAASPTNPAKGIDVMTAGRDITGVQIGDANAPTMKPQVIYAFRDLSGTIAVADIDFMIRADNNFSGTLTFGNPAPLTAGYTPTQKVRIGNDLSTGAVIQLPARDTQAHTGGLPFGIVINANSRAANPTSGQWLGRVRLGSDTLAPDTAQIGQYSKTHDQVGGGGVGLLPYRIHGSETQARFIEDVENGLTQTISESPSLPPNTVVGKVHRAHPEKLHADWAWFESVHEKFAAGTPPPLESYLTIQRRVFVPGQGSEVNWVTMTEVIDPHYNFGSSDARRTTLGGKDSNGDFTEYTQTSHQYLNDYQYRFVPNQANSGSELLRTIRCNVAPDVGGGEPAAPPAAPDQFVFLNGNGCPTDINADGVTSTADLTVLLSHFGCPCPSDPQCPCGGLPLGLGILGDLNADDYVNTSDLTLLLVKFGQTCTVTDGNLTAGGHTPHAPAPALVLALAGTGIGGGSTSTETAANHHDDAQENGTSGIGGPASTASTLPTPPGPLLSAPGFTSAQAYQSYIDALTPEGLGEHLEFIAAFARAMEN